MDWSRIEQTLTDSTRALFRAYGVPLDKAKASTPWGENDTFVAVVGFSGDTIQGSLVLCLYPRVVAASYPVKGAVQERDELGWTGELTNQLLGRFKNSLLSLGIEIRVGTPTTLRARSIHIGASRPTARVVERVFTCSGEPVIVRLEVASREGAELGVGAAPEIPEGGMQLF